MSESSEFKEQVDVVYTDFLKSFESIDHSILLMKLPNFFVFWQGECNVLSTLATFPTKFLTYLAFHKILS